MTRHGDEFATADRALLRRYDRHPHSHAGIVGVAGRANGDPSPNGINVSIDDAGG